MSFQVFQFVLTPEEAVESGNIAVLEAGVRVVAVELSATGSAASNSALATLYIL